MAVPNSSSMRVLIRPPPSTPPLDPSLPPLPPPTSIRLSPPPPPLPTGITVVGFVGRRRGDVTQLINRIVDSNVFGSSNVDKKFSVHIDEVSEELRAWFQCRDISYFHEKEKGILHLQFSSTLCPAMEGFSDAQLEFDSLFEELQFGDLQGLLFMFSVCHVIIYIQEGLRFDIQNLRKFRVLQAAKHAMSPYIKSQINPSAANSSNSSSFSRISPSKSSSKHRNSSAVTLMSGLGSCSSLLPGQCTPVTLFVFIDDFIDVNPNSNTDESAENSSNQKGLPGKKSGPVSVLSRPVTKSEGGFKKKLQSSLEAQIRFSIKKCKTLTGSEQGQAGSRNGFILSSTPLFSLDASKAVALVDFRSNQSCESLDFATEMVENILNGTASSDSLLLEIHNQSMNREDILSVKEFIYKQTDLIRGRGGRLSNSSNGPAGGVGMVALAAAAASAASGKTSSTPELPSLEIWLSSSRLILHGIISRKCGSVGDPLETAVSYLDNSRGLNCKFSTFWCQKAFPVAKEVYLKDLPDCYPTLQHESQLEKALYVFKSMVKGPSVQIFLKKLEDECNSVWNSGRQQCDAVSLTGQPCIHQRHDETKPHSSKSVFLHACACGRSRKLRADPFDFETANSISNCYPECDKILNSIQLLEKSSWSLIRIGNAAYYDHSRGLIQSGFCNTQKFLQKWNIFLEKQTEYHVLQKTSMNKVELVDEQKSKIEVLTKTNTGPHDKNIVPNYTMKKPFSEVVAGSGVADSAFPPLQSRKKVITEKGIKLDSNKTPKIEDKDNSQILQIGSTIIPMSFSGGEKMKLPPSFKHVTMYIGFEYECPRGHRFILNPEHLTGLGALYAETQGDNCLKPGKNVGPGRIHRQFSKSFKGQNGDYSRDLEVGFDSVNLDDSGSAFSLLNRNLPVYMNCPRCKVLKYKDQANSKFGSTISQLQRIFMVTPAFPVVLATCPVIQFEASYLPPSVLNREQKLQFSVGCRVILPPESFISLRLPFIYGVKLDNGSFLTLKPFENHPELSAWITKSTTLQVLCKGSSNPEEIQLT